MGFFPRYVVIKMPDIDSTLGTNGGQQLSYQYPLVVVSTTRLMST
jgi:hypothetical protein